VGYLGGAGRYLPRCEPSCTRQPGRGARRGRLGGTHRARPAPAGGRGQRRHGGRRRRYRPQDRRAALLPRPHAARPDPRAGGRLLPRREPVHAPGRPRPRQPTRLRRRRSPRARRGPLPARRRGPARRGPARRDGPLRRRDAGGPRQRRPRHLPPRVRAGKLSPAPDGPPIPAPCPPPLQNFFPETVRKGKILRASPCRAHPRPPVTARAAPRGAACGTGVGRRLPRAAGR
jgi:hypothetical protein